MAADKKNRAARSAFSSIVLAAILLAVAGTIYYAVQSPADECFNLLYLALMTGGACAAALHLATRAYCLLPVSGMLLGVAFGVMIHDMLPTMSDVWNGVNFIGGNLTAYLIYTGVSLISAVLIIITCFTGTEKNGKA